MSLRKNISGGQLWVPALGQYVEDGETVDLPDDQGDGESPITWPENRWQAADVPKVEAEQPKAAAKSKDAA